MRNRMAVFYGSMTVAALAAAVSGTGRTRLESIPDRLPEAVTAADPLPASLMAGWRAVELYEVQEESLIAGDPRRTDLPGGTELLPNARIFSGVSAGIPDTGNSGIPIGGQGGRNEGRQGILDGTDGGPSWGWLADEVNAAAGMPERDNDSRSPQSSGSRTQPQGTDRPGTRFGSGNDEDSFFFQRRQDDRFQP